MIKDINGTEFNYLDYVVYLKQGKPKLGRIKKIVIDRKPRIVCIIDGYGVATLTNLDNVEIIPERKANELFDDTFKFIRSQYI